MLSDVIFVVSTSSSCTKSVHVSECRRAWRIDIFRRYVIEWNDFFHHKPMFSQHNTVIVASTPNCKSLHPGTRPNGIKLHVWIPYRVGK